VLVFTRTKHGANRVVQQLERDKITAEAIHGNKSQSARLRALGNFKSGHTQVLVATDIAARGLDIDGVSHVINFDLPNVPETYVHRIGRTGRAGASGRAISFCDHEEKEYLRDITRLIRRDIPVVTDHPFVMVGGPKKAEPEVREPRQPRGPGRQGQQRGQQQQRNAPPARSSNGSSPGAASAERSGDPRKRRRNRPGRPQQTRTEGQERTTERQPQQQADRRQPARNDRAPRQGRPQGDRNQQRPERQRTERPPQQRSANTGGTDYAKLTKELFGEVEQGGAERDQPEKKKKGFGLGRLFGR
jgi:ATP-dependent RNA helicase RhlE